MKYLAREQKSTYIKQQYDQQYYMMRRQWQWLLRPEKTTDIVRINHALRQEIKEDIVKKTEQQTAKWPDRISRTVTGRTVFSILELKPVGTRRKSRPR